MSNKPRFSRNFLNILIIVTALAILLLSSMNPKPPAEPPAEPATSEQKNS